MLNKNWVHVFTAIMAGFGATNVLAQPVAVVSPLAVDFGEVKPDGRASAEVTAKNNGDEPLVIDRVVSSCPCLSVPSFESNVTIAPGQAATLDLLYVPEGPVGQRGATLAIMTNDPEAPAHIVETVVVVRVPIVVKPPEGLAFGYAPRGFMIHKDIQFRAWNAETKIALDRIATRHPGLHVDAESGRDAKGDFVIARFTLADDIPLGRMETFVDAEFETDSGLESITLPISGSVLGDVLITPSAINSPKSLRPRGEKISEISVRTILKNTKPPRIIDAFTEGPLAVAIRNDADPDRHVIDVFVSDDAPAGPQAGRVYVVTESADQPIVRVPVFFQVADFILANPQYIEFGPNGGTVEIELVSATNETFDIREIVHNGGVTSKVLGGEGTRTDPIRIEVTVDAGRTGTHIVIHPNTTPSAPLVIAIVAR